MRYRDARCIKVLRLKTSDMSPDQLKMLRTMSHLMLEWPLELSAGEGQWWPLQTEEGEQDWGPLRPGIEEQSQTVSNTFHLILFHLCS